MPKSSARNVGVHDTKGIMVRDAILGFAFKRRKEGIMLGGRTSFLVVRTFSPSMKPSIQMPTH